MLPVELETECTRSRHVSWYDWFIVLDTCYKITVGLLPGPRVIRYQGVRHLVRHMIDAGKIQLELTSESIRVHPSRRLLLNHLINSSES